MDDLMERLRSQLAFVQRDLKTKTVTATAANGWVKVSANGHQELTAITLDPSALRPQNKASLEEAVLEGVNKALLLSRHLLQEEISRLAAGINPDQFSDFL